MAYRTSERQIIYKLYDKDGTFIRNLDEVISELSIEKKLFGGSGPVTLVFKKKIDELPPDIDFNKKIKIYVKNKWSSTPRLVYYGYIVSINPIYAENREQTGVTCLGAISKLSNDFLQQEGQYLAYEVENQKIDEHIRRILRNYRESILAAHGSYDPSMIADPDTYWSDTNYIEDTSGMGKIYYRYFERKHLEAIKEICRFLRKNPLDGQEYWIWWLDDGKEGAVDSGARFHLRKIQSLTPVTLQLRKHITSLEMRKNIEGVINTVYFWNEFGRKDEKILFKKQDSESTKKFDIISETVRDSQVQHKDAAELIAEAKLGENKDESYEATVEVSESNFDILTFEPGQLINIRDVKDTNLFKDKMIIKKLILKEDRAVLELSTLRPDLSTQVETDREYIDKQLKWIGNIMLRIDSNRLIPGSLHWTTEDIEFSAPSNAEIQWLENDETKRGTFKIGEDIKRVICGGTSGTMSTGVKYYFYIDEYNKWTLKDENPSASPDESGTGSIKAGENILTDTSKNWDKDQWSGYVLIVTYGDTEERHIITKNYSTFLEVESWDPFNSDQEAVSYEIWPFALRKTHDRGTGILSKSSTATGGSTTTVNDTTLAEPTDFWKGYAVRILSGENIGLSRMVTAWNSSTKNLTLDKPLPYPVESGTKYELFLYPDTQVVIVSGVADADSKNKARVDPKIGQVMEGTTPQKGGKKANDALTDDSYLRKIIRSDKIEFLDPETVGLNITQTHMGYYDGASWKAYIQNNGNFYFGGNASNYIQWNGSSLTVSGTINVVGGDAFSKTNDTLDDIQDGATYVKTTSNEKIGAGRGYYALNASNRYKQWLLASELTPGSNPSTGLIIDYYGIRGYAGGIKTFEVNRATGSAYFRGEIGASNITASVAVKSGNLLTLDSSTATGVFIIYASGYNALITNGRIGGNLYLDVQSGGSVVFSVGQSIKTFIDDMGDIHIGAGNALLDNSSNTAELRINKNFVPSANNSYTLGSSGLQWSDIRGVNETLSGNLYVQGDIYTALNTPNIRDIVPLSDSYYDCGLPNYKWYRGYFDSLPTCPLPTANSAIDILKKIKSPKIMKGKHGERFYFPNAHFPPEMQILPEEANAKGKIPDSEPTIDLVKTIGVTVQAVRELIQKVEDLENKLNNRE